MVSLLLKGLLVGFSIAAPVGPIGVLCINRSLRQGLKSGLISGFGAASAHTLYGCIAGFGLVFISKFLTGHQSWIKIVGGCFLIYLGIRMFLAKPADQNTNSSSERLFRSYASTLCLTLTSPMTMILFIALFSGFGLGSLHTSHLSASILILGVFLGSLSWWLLLTGGISFFHSKINEKILRWINAFSGLVLVAFACGAFLEI